MPNDPARAPEATQQEGGVSEIERLLQQTRDRLDCGRTQFYALRERIADMTPEQHREYTALIVLGVLSGNRHALAVRAGTTADWP